MKQKMISLTLAAAITLAFAMLVWAAVPPPPVNQNIGLPDTQLNALVEADCRVCHSTNPPPGIPTDPTYLPDRHHLNVGTTIPLGSCADTPNSCQLDSDCYDFCDGDPTIMCTTDAECGVNGPCVIGENYCIGDSQAPNATLTSPASGQYECLTCHTLIWDPVSMTSQFAPFRDCFICHTVEFQPDHPDRTQEANVHHRAGEAPKGNCAYCHGALVDSGLVDADTDGFADTVNAPWVPTYQPSLVTPWPSEKNFGRCDETCDVGGTNTCSVSGDPCNSDADCGGSDTQCVTDANCPIAGEVCNLDLDGGGGGAANARGTEEGNCNYCHDSSTTDTCDEVSETCVASGDPCLIDADCNGPILINHDTHHFTGATGLVPGGACWFCHPVRTPTRTTADMRACETCHGIPSLHNIQADSPATPGTIDPGMEDPYWGHIGSNTDCNGCHGFSVASAPGSGPVVPHISSADYLTMTSGADKTVTLTGAAFTNTVMGTIELTSDVELTASDGSTTTLTPESITEYEIVVTLPGSLAAGNYDLRAVKGPKSSNPVVVSVTPAVAITDTACNKKKGVLTITGSGFSEKPEGTDDYISVLVNGEQADLISWTDSQIKASISGCSNKDTITVNALYGSDTSDGSGGKPPKPCKGKGCNK